MKIGIDISQIVYQTGVSNYTKNIVQGLAPLIPKENLILFGSSLRQQQSLNNFVSSLGTDGKIFPFPPTMLETLWNKVHLFPIENFTGPLDLFHTSDWTQPPTKHAKKITTIHDLVVYKFPETLHPKIVSVQKQTLSWAKKECSLIIAVSQSTKKDIHDILQIENEKIRVIYEAASPEYEQFDRLSENQKKDQLVRVKNKYNLTRDYFLSVGTLEPRKNLPRLIEAFNQTTPTDLDFVVVGKYGWGQQNQPTAKNVKHLGAVVQADLPALYFGAKALVHPSIYEGFGLQVVEAMTVGTPVLTSNVSSLPEVAGDDAIYFDPYNVSDIAAKIKKLLTLSDSQYSNLKKASKQQSKKFSWEKAAKQTFKLYEEICQTK